MHRTTFGRWASVLVLVAAVLAAVALVSVPLRDHSTQCGSAIDSAWSGVHMPRADSRPVVGAPSIAVDSEYAPATVCRNMAREHILGAATVIGVAVVGADAVRRRSRTAPPAQLEPRAAAP